MNLRNELSGTGVALITPFTNDGAVDYTALEQLINTVIDGGVNYLVTLGTTGETPTLTSAEKIGIINFTCTISNNRVPVVVGIGGNNTPDVIENLKTYPLDKAVAVLSASPYYNKPSQEGIFQHYKALATASSKPILLYNVPGRTGSNISASTTLRLANKVPNIAGIKEASGNMIQCMHILEKRPAGFLVTSGDDHLTLPLIAAGMDGVISVVANCFPKEFATMVNHCLKNNFDAARTIHYQLLQANDLLFAENNPAGAKAFLYEMGRIKNVLRLPLVPLGETVHRQIKAYLESNKK